MRIVYRAAVISAAGALLGCGEMMTQVAPAGISPQIQLPSAAREHRVRFNMNFVIGFDRDVTGFRKSVGRQESIDYLSVGTSRLDRLCSTRDWDYVVDLGERDKDEHVTEVSATLLSDCSNEVDPRSAVGLAKAIIACDATTTDAYVYRWKFAAAVTGTQRSFAPDKVYLAAICTIGIDRKGLGAAEKHYRPISQINSQAVERLRVQITAEIFNVYRTAFAARGIKVSVQ